MARRHMQSRDPKLQPTSFRHILDHASFFATNDLVYVENFLTDLPLKPESAREKFFTEELMDRLLRIDSNSLASQIAPLLLSRLVLLNKTAVEHFLPHFLQPKIDDLSTTGLLTLI